MNKYKFIILNTIGQNIVFSYPFDDSKEHSGKINDINFKIFSYSYNYILYQIQFWQILYPLKYDSIIKNNESILEDNDAYILIVDINNIDNETFDKYKQYVDFEKTYLIIINLENKIIPTDILNKIDIHRYFKIDKITTVISKKIIKKIINNFIELKINTLEDIDLHEDEKDHLINSNVHKKRWEKLIHKLLCCMNSKILKI